MARQTWQQGGSFPSIIDNALLGAAKTNGSFNYLAVMNLLASDANTNILSTPTLVTLDNEEAEIVIGENVPFVTGSFHQYRRKRWCDQPVSDH